MKAKDILLDDIYEECSELLTKNLPVPLFPSDAAIAAGYYDEQKCFKPIHAITQFKRWEREAKKLPTPIEHGVWTVSPGGVYFITQLIREPVFMSENWQLCWQPCNADLIPSGLSFCRTPVFTNG